MEKLNFRALRPDEVDVRVAQCKQNGVSLLLYKDARCDMNILDETVGPERWQRHHSRENANCTVSIYVPDMDQWVEKEDTGTESNTEAEKGLASDSFKRACFNWGIGRELYTAPFIWIPSESCTIKPKGQGTFACYDRFRVAEMTVEVGKITSIAIANDSMKGAIVYRYGQSAQEAPRRTEAAKPASKTAKKEKPAEKPTAAPLDDTQVATLNAIITKNNLNATALLAQYGVAAIRDLSPENYDDILGRVQRWISSQKGAQA